MCKIDNSMKYTCTGKQYHNEPAIISLTSWRARITTVGLTIYTLLQSCPGFHITLVLASEEFPNHDAELPKDLLTIVKANLIEILWVPKNWRAFKKAYPVSVKYSSVPIITADDDLMYIDNYAKLLYNKWLQLPTSCIGLSSSVYENAGDYTVAGLWGYAQLFPPKFFTTINEQFIDTIVKLGCIDDDGLYMEMRRKYHINAYSFQLPFKNPYVASNELANQFTSITKARTSHTLNDKDIYRRLLS